VRAGTCSPLNHLRSATLLEGLPNEILIQGKEIMSLNAFSRYCNKKKPLLGT